MVVLVVGSTGFLGNLICNFLFRNPKYTVLTLSKYSRQLGEKPELDPLVLRFGDTKPRHLSSIDTSKSALILCAGPNATECSQDPEGSLKEYLTLTNRCLHLVRSHQFSRFIKLSTIHVYRSPLVGLISPTSRINNQHPYAKAHARSDELICETSRRYPARTSHSILRLSNIVGMPINPRDSFWSLAVPYITRNLLLYRQVTLQQPCAYRNYVPSKIFLREIERSLRSPDPNEQCQVEILSSDLYLTTSALALEIREVIQQFLPREKLLITQSNKTNETLPNNLFKILGKSDTQDSDINTSKKPLEPDVLNICNHILRSQKC